MLRITEVNAFSDNYIWLLEQEATLTCVDPGDAAPVLQALKQYNKALTHILITHHHKDHIGGIKALKEAYPTCTVIGPESVQHLADKCVQHHDLITIEDMTFQVIATPGHTLDHLCYYHPKALFCGDTLFSAGCGRLFEGTPDIMWQSLSLLKALPAETPVYCAHEYTQANVDFARSIEPNNSALRTYSTWVASQRKQNQCTLPSSIAQECAINPFMRADEPCLQAAARAHLPGLSANTPTDYFKAIRHAKDHW